MCDIIHVLYEEDATPLYEEHQKIKSDVRVAMWRHLYNKNYPYPHQDNQTSNAGGLPPEEALLPDEAAPKPLKPYIPPTDDFSQFQEAGLDAPMGGEMPWQ